MNEIEAIALKGKGPTFSIFKETWGAMKAHLRLILAASLIFGAIYGAVYHFSPVKELNLPISEMCESQLDVQACQAEHKAEIQQEALNFGLELWDNISMLSLLFFFAMVAFAYAYYYISVRYLQRTVVGAPEVSMGAFWRYVCLLSWKYTRPILWNFIPVLGQIMYIRSLVRYDLVGYLTLMGHDAPLKASWQITKGNVWRLIGVQIAWGIITAILVSIVMLPLSLVVLSLITDATSATLLGMALQGVGTGIGSMVAVFISFAAFSVLIQEWKDKEKPAEQVE